MAGPTISTSSNIKIYVDTNTNGSYDPGTDVEITYLDQVAADASRTVFVVADVPLGRSTNDVAGVRLTATASEATAAGSLGATVTQTSGANTAGVDTVFADGNAERQRRARRHPLRRGRLHDPGRVADRDQDQPGDQRSVQRHDRPEDDPGRGGRILHRGGQRRGQRHRDQRQRVRRACRRRRPTMPRSASSSTAPSPERPATPTASPAAPMPPESSAARSATSPPASPGRSSSG